MIIVLKVGFLMILVQLLVMLIYLFMRPMSFGVLVGVGLIGPFLIRVLNLVPFYVIAMA